MKTHERGPRWTDGVRDVLAAARARSFARNDWLITDLDLLDALLDGDQAVRALLAGAGVDVAALRHRVDVHSDAQPEDATAAANAHLTYSDAVAEALQRATQLAIAGGHARVDSAHLLAALTQSRRSAARLLLLEAGASRSAIERAARGTADARPDHPASATPSPEREAGVAPACGAVPTGQPPALQPRRVRPDWDTVGGVALAIVIGLARILRRNLQLANGALTIGVFFPGAVGLIGFRAFIAQLTNVPHRVDLATWPQVVNVGAAPGPWRRIAVRLGPPAILITIGAVMLTPYLIWFAVLSTAPVPILLHDPEVAFRSDVVITVGTQLVALYGPMDMLRLWVGVSLWFWSAPTYELIRDSRADLRTAAGMAGVGRRLASLLRACLAVPQALLRLIKPLEELALWAGGNVVMATGGVTVLVLFVLELSILRWLW